MKTRILKIQLKFLLSLLFLATIGISSVSAQKDLNTITISKENGQKQRVELYKNSYALVIGNVLYQNGWQDLRGYLKEVFEVQDTLEKKGFNVEVAVDVSRDSFRTKIENFINTHGLKESNRLIVYFVGYGYTEKVGNQEVGYIVMRNSPLPQKNIRLFRQRSIEMSEIESFAKRIKAKHALFVFDSCFSNSLTRNFGSRPSKAINAKILKPVRQFIISGSANQTMPDRSVFRVMFQRALNGEADSNKDNYVTGSELGFFLEQKVADYTNNSQTPQYSKIRDIALDEGDIIFSVRNTKLSTEAKANSESDGCSKSLKYFPLSPEEIRDPVKSKQAFAEANKLISSGKECFAAYLNRGFIYLHQGKSELALKDASKLIELAPNVSTGYATKAHFYYQLNNFEKAAEEYSRAILICEKKSVCSDVLMLLLERRGISYRLTDKFDLAIKDFTRLIELSPSYARGYFNRGNVYYNMANISHLKFMTSVLRKEPNSELTQQTLKEAKLALDDLNKAISLNPTFINFYIRGSVYNILGLFGIAVKDYTYVRQAIRDLTKSIEMNPNYPDSYKKLDSIYMVLGEKEELQADFKKFIEMKKNRK